MKKLLSLLIIFTIFFALVSCHKQPETTYAGEKRSYTEKIKGDGTVEYRWYYRYNPNGEISTSSRCIADGTCVQRDSYTYNDSNAVLSKTSYLLGKKAAYTEYIYSDDNKLIREKIYLPDEYKETAYEYNDDGNISFSKDYNLAGEIIGFKHLSYDSSGNLTSEKYYDGNENYLGGITYIYENSLLTHKEYDGNQIVKITETDQEGNVTVLALISKEQYHYTGDNITKTFYFDSAENRIYTETAEYENDNCIHRVRVDADNSIVYTWTAYYDSFMSLIG